MDSPDGSHNAMIEEANEIGMGAPTRGDLVISAGITIPDCGPSIVWSDDSQFLAAPQWQPFSNGHRQRLVVISVAQLEFRRIGREYATLELESFIGGIVRGIDRPATDCVAVEIDTRQIDW